MSESDYPAPEVISADPGPNGEVGTPDNEIERCDCGVLFRRGGWHRCEDTGERVEWSDYINE